MAQYESITMSQKQFSRYDIIKNLIDGFINGTEAAKQISLSVRQIRRLKVRVKKYGHKGIIHGNKGRQSNRHFPDDTVKKIIDLLEKKYSDFHPTHASEMLDENHDIQINKESVRQIMIKEKLWKPKPRRTNKEYRSWRPRKEYYGEMEQFDGSYHKWFEDRAPECCLLAAIDDATGKITKAKFDSSEGVIPVFAFWKEYSENQGKPLKIYLDRYSTYKINTKHLLDDPEAITQFERAMMDLNIKVIHARSPQAKGRIENLFGTLQNRLIKEMRLEKISSFEEANRFLEEKFIPKFNEKFAVIPQKKKDLHKTINKMEKKNLDKIFSIQDEKKVHNDFTVSYEGKWYQLDRKQPTLVCRKDKTLIEKRISGEIFISLRDKYLSFKELPKRPEKECKMRITALTRKPSNWKPPINHPWRRQLIFKNNLQKVEQLQPAINENKSQVGHF